MLRQLTRHQTAAILPARRAAGRCGTGRYRNSRTPRVRPDSVIDDPHLLTARAVCFEKHRLTSAEKLATGIFWPAARVTRSATGLRLQNQSA